MNLNKLINDIVVSNVTIFYKEWVIRSKTDDYNSIEKYFEKYGKGKFQFETSWAYIEYKKWIESDIYVDDIKKVTAIFKNDIIEGFNINMEETINMEDDEDIQQNFIEMQNEFNLLKTDEEKFEYLSTKYNEDMYYPNDFNISWLFDVFDERIVSDIS